MQRHSIGCRVPFPRRPALDPPETVGGDAGDGIRCAPPTASRSCMMAQMCLHAESRLNVSILMVGEKLGLLLLLGSPVVAGQGLHATPLVVLTGMSLTLYRHILYYLYLSTGPLRVEGAVEYCHPCKSSRSAIHVQQIHCRHVRMQCG
eukprot:SAG25_NODE_1_length_41698_cov_149.842015_35_plen_148_part_00